MPPPFPVDVALCALAIVLAVALLLRPWTRRMVAERRARRTVIRDRFRMFASTNRVVALRDEQIERFWLDTRDTRSVFWCVDAQPLRDELHERATRLREARAGLERASGRGEGRDALISLRDEQVRWFGEALERIDALPDEPVDRVPSYADVCRECLRLCGRELRG